jgi:ADP-heptose:LPS heptosyltransferase
MRPGLKEFPVQYTLPHLMSAHALIERNGTTHADAAPALVVVHPGGLGDLVLLSGLIAGLKRDRAEAETVLVCTASVAAVTELYPMPPDRVVRLPFQPLQCIEPSDELEGAVRALIGELAGRPVELLVDAGLVSSWLAGVLAAALVPARALSHGFDEGGDALLAALLGRLGLSARPVERSIPAPDGHELARYRKLARTLGAAAVAAPWRIPDELDRTAAVWLQGHGLEPGRYLMCAPFGAASTAVKRWPMENFAALLRQSFSSSGWPVLLLGGEEERELLAALAALLCDIPTATFAGRSGELPLAAALIARAGAYAANDAGAMHLAQAFGVPGVALFGGGGRWPAYAPWGVGSVGLCHPLPCFGCRWDCFLGHGLCVEAIPVSEAVEALEEARRNPGAMPRVRSLDTVREPLLGLVADASARFREAQYDRAERLRVIGVLNLAREEQARRERELKARLAEVEARAAAMECVARERLAVLESVHIEAARRLDMVEKIATEAERRRLLIEELSTRLAAPPIMPSAATGAGRHWIATGAARESFANLRLTVASWWRHNRELPLLVCDFGMTAKQREEASVWPVALIESGARQGKAALADSLLAAGADWKSVTWIDSDAIFLRTLPALDEWMLEYDVAAAVASTRPVLSAAARQVVPLAAVDAWLCSACFTTASAPLLNAYSRVEAALGACACGCADAALTAAARTVRARLRPLSAPLWIVRGADQLDRVAVDGDWVGCAGECVFVLSADSRYVVREDGRRVFTRDLLRAIQAGCERAYEEAVLAWREAPRG